MTCVPSGRILETGGAVLGKGDPWERKAYLMGRDTSKPQECLFYKKRESAEEALKFSNFETDTMQESNQLGKHGGHKLRKGPIKKGHVKTKKLPAYRNQ